MLLRLLPASLAIALVASCYQQDTTAYSTLPEPPMAYSGPPGGGIDPGWQQGAYDPQQPGYPQGYPEGYAPGYPAGTEDVAAMQTDGELVASADPNADGYVMGAPTDGDIDATLDGYGEWEYVEDYGEVWRPYATVVGLDFTPYESCGTWVWTDWGWTFACEWDWGWLPFHYGRWGWFGDAWAWQPGYDWSPGWVDWRSGGEYCGWRPSPPTQTTSTQYGPVIRDHRKHKGAWSVADGTPPPTAMDSHWRFQKVKDFGKRIRPNLMKNPAEGLASTSIVARPPFKASTRALDAATVMAGRLPLLAARHAGTRVGAGNPRAPQRPTIEPGRRPDYGPRTLPPPRRYPPRGYDRRPPDPDAIDRLWPHTPAQADAPSTAPDRDRPPVRAAEPPRSPSDPWSPARSPTLTQPSRVPPPQSPTWTPPSHASPPGGSTWSPSHSSPSPTWTPPSHGSPPSSPTWTPSHGSSSHGTSSSSPPSPPSHPSGGGGWSPPSHSSGGGGGGGHRR